MEALDLNTEVCREAAVIEAGHVAIHLVTEAYVMQLSVARMGR
jgi:hypothetical protein